MGRPPKGIKRNKKLSLNPFAENKFETFEETKKVSNGDLFEQKYKPLSLDDYIGSKKTNKDSIKTFQSIISSPIKKLTIVYGNIGCGKSCLIEILLSNYDVIEISNDTHSDKSSLFDKIEKSIYSQSISTFIGGKKKAIVIEDLDKTIGENTYYKKLLDLIDEASKKIELTCPIIAITSNLKKKFNTPTKVNLIEIKTLDLEEMMNFVSNITKSEQLSISTKAMKTLILFSKFDFRKILHSLKLISYSGKTKKLTQTEILNVLRFSEADANFSAFEIVREFFDGEKNDNLEDMINYCYSDQNTISELIFSNLGKLNNISSISTILDDICDSDVLHSKMFDDQNWDLKEYSIIFGCIEPLIEIADRKPLKKIVLRNNFLNNYSVMLSKGRNMYHELNYKRVDKYNPMDHRYVFDNINSFSDNKDIKEYVKKLYNFGHDKNTFHKMNNSSKKTIKFNKSDIVKIDKCFDEEEKLLIVERKPGKIKF